MAIVFNKRQLISSLFNVFRKELSFVNKCLDAYWNDSTSRYYHNYDATFSHVASCFNDIDSVLFYADDIGLLSPERRLFFSRYFDCLRCDCLSRIPLVS